MNNKWRFTDPENLAVITLDRILGGATRILYVQHDHDGGWQFLDGSDVAEENAMIVSLRSICDHDPTVIELADLPCGWCAGRDSADRPWKRCPKAE